MECSFGRISKRVCTGSVQPVVAFDDQTVDNEPGISSLAQRLKYRGLFLMKILNT